jgi:hypothetical protein
LAQGKVHFDFFISATVACLAFQVNTGVPKRILGLNTFISAGEKNCLEVACQAWHWAGVSFLLIACV